MNPSARSLRRGTFAAALANAGAKCLLVRPVTPQAGIPGFSQ